MEVFGTSAPIESYTKVFGTSAPIESYTKVFGTSAPIESYTKVYDQYPSRVTHPVYDASSGYVSISKSTMPSEAQLEADIQAENKANLTTSEKAYVDQYMRTKALQSLTSDVVAQQQAAKEAQAKENAQMKAYIVKNSTILKKAAQAASISDVANALAHNYASNAIAIKSLTSYVAKASANAHKTSTSRPVCGSGTVYNGTTNTCDSLGSIEVVTPNPTCATGMVYNPLTKTCESLTTIEKKATSSTPAASTSSIPIIGKTGIDTTIIVIAALTLIGMMIIR